MSGNSVDQAFVLLKGWLLSFVSSAPDWVQAVASSLINIAGVLGVFAILAIANVVSNYRD